MVSRQGEGKAAIPGVGLAYQDDWRLGDWGTRLYFTLAGITQGGAEAAINQLLLLD